MHICTVAVIVDKIMIKPLEILQLLCIYNKRVTCFIMQCRDLSSDDCLTWKHWSKLKGDTSFQP